jgi:hypothetical protein
MTMKRRDTEGWDDMQVGESDDEEEFDVDVKSIVAKSPKDDRSKPPAAQKAITAPAPTAAIVPPPLVTIKRRQVSDDDDADEEPVSVSVPSAGSGAEEPSAKKKAVPKSMPLFSNEGILRYAIQLLCLLD